jgi:hypothetical protein
MDEILNEWAKSVNKQYKMPKCTQLLNVLNDIPISPQSVEPQDIPPLG